MEGETKKMTVVYACRDAENVHQMPLVQDALPARSVEVVYPKYLPE